MKPITEYKDYRLYMQDFYEERKRTSAFSWREFSKLAGFKSPVYLKLVCEGKSSLSFVKMEQVAHAMGLAGHEFAYFTQMVKFGNATKDSVKKEALLEMQKIAREHQVRVVDAESFEFYESWKNPTIRELAPMMPGKRPLEVAKTCHFLKREAEHTYVQTEKTVIGTKESLPIAVRGMHKEMASLARTAIDKFPIEERHFTGATLGLCEEAYARISQELDAFVRKVANIAAEYENINQVYRLNLQLFPLTKKVEEESHE